MRVEKIQMAEYVTEMVRDASYLYLISYLGINVAQFTDLRGKLDQVGARCRVLKNSYIGLGLKANSVDVNGFTLSGDTALVHGAGDPCPAAKVIKEFGKTNEVVKFKAGIVEGSFIDAAGAAAVAELPPKEVLQAQLLGVLQGPSRNLVSVLNQKVASIAYVLQAYLQKLEEQS